MRAACSQNLKELSTVPSMALSPLSKEVRIEFALNNEGKAVLFHKGPLQHDYCWIQFDPHFGAIQLVTEDGETQDLGLVLPEHVKKIIQKTGEVSLLELTEGNKCQRFVLVVFNTVLN